MKNGRVIPTVFLLVLAGSGYPSSRTQKMKSFTYAARDMSGALKQGSVEAADRAEAIGLLKAQGLAAVSLTEDAAPRKPGSNIRFAVYSGASAVALILAGDAAWRRVPEKWAGKAEAIAEGRVPERPKPKTVPHAETKPADTPSVSFETGSGTGGEPGDTTRPERPDPVPPAGCTTPLPEPPADGQSVETAPALPVGRPQTGYSSGTERVINMIVNAQLGSPPPPLLQLPPGEDIEEILGRDILLFDDDDDKMRQEKENVAYAKQLLKEHLGQGGTTETFLRHYHGQLTQAFDEWREAQKKATLLLKSGDEKAASEFIEMQNLNFSARGIRPIMPPPVKK